MLVSTSAIRLAGSSARSILPDTRAGNHCPDGGRLSRDRFFDHCREFLTNREDQLYAAAEIQRRRWWIPKAVNRQIAKAIIGGVKEIIPNLREPGGVARQNLLRGIEHLAQKLCASPEYRARVEEAKLRLLEDARACVAVGPRFANLTNPSNLCRSNLLARSKSARRPATARPAQSHDRSAGDKGNSVACQTGAVYYRRGPAVGRRELHRARRAGRRPRPTIHSHKRNLGGRSRRSFPYTDSKPSCPSREGVA